jgi:hypothetical protein
MKTYRYTLEPYKGPNSRYTCPQCGKKQSFVRYIDTQTGNHVAHDIGRCNREEKCGYHKKPNVNTPLTPLKERKNNPVIQTKKKNTSLPSVETVGYHASLDNYYRNQLVLYLHSILPYPDMERVVDAYHIGTQGTSTVFWQIDMNGQIRGGKVMAYDQHTGKRIKDIPNAIQWMHTIHKVEGFELKQCLFGEHLLRDNDTAVGVVESEKTALIAAALMPHIVWVATGGVNNLSVEKCNVLSGRKVTLYPDAGAYDKWLEVSKQILGCGISPLLEQGFSPGSDIADYLLAA